MRIKKQVLEMVCCVLLISGVLHLRILLFENHNGNKTRAIADYSNSQHMNEIESTQIKEQTMNPKTQIPKSYMMSGGFPLTFSVEGALKYGHFKDKKGFLTIGVPSIKRKHDYLFDTVDSLLNQSSTSDRENVTIVIMFCDDDQSWNFNQSYVMSQKFREEITSGLIQMAILPPQNYPDFNKLQRTFNDPVQRLKWRSKQNIHYAYLMKYCHNISEYYLHLEDDVIAAPGYIKDIKQYKRIYQNDWLFIRFSSLGFIGIFSRSSDLLTISDYLLLFYAVQPCDFLIETLRKIKLQVTEIRYHPSLFQHYGRFSSLKNKVQLLKDKFFKGIHHIPRSVQQNLTARKDFSQYMFRKSKRYSKHINPPAKIHTNMAVHGNYFPEKAYRSSDSFFWAESPKKGQNYTIILDEPQTLISIIVVGGCPSKETDIIMYGELQVSSTKDCSKWSTIGKLHIGSFNMPPTLRQQLKPILFSVNCVRIAVTRTQQNWAIISEIALLHRPAYK